MVQMSFEERYAGLSDEELLMIAASRTDLVQEATVALDTEMARRGLSYQQARAKKRQVARLEYKEDTKHSKPSKYLLRNLDWGMFLFGLPLILLSLTTFYFLPAEWNFPIFETSMGAVLAVSIVRPWLYRTISFWLSLVIACNVQLLIGHWLNVHDATQARHDIKGVGSLTVIVGYVVGAFVFLLIQRLKPNAPSGRSIPNDD
jgi:hypothetical protein